MKEITDWQFDEELQDRAPVYVVAFADRTRLVHRRFLRQMSVVAARGGAMFRWVDVAENPSLALRRNVGRVPAVEVFVEGVRVGRWDGAGRVDEVRAAVGFLDRAQRSGESAGE